MYSDEIILPCDLRGKQCQINVLTASHLCSTIFPMLRFAQKAETDAINQIRQSLRINPEVEKAILYGSRIRGDFHGESDIDILVVVPDIKSKDRIISILHDIEIDYDVPLSPVIMTSREFIMNEKLGSGFIRNIEKEGIVLYDSQRQ